MAGNLSIRGHAYIKELYYCQGGQSQRVSYELPGGAAMLEKLLGQRDLAQEERASLRREFFECAVQENANGEKCIVPTRRLGIRTGKNKLNSDKSGYAVVLDNGFEVNDEGESLLAVEDAQHIFWASRKVPPSAAQAKKIEFLMLDARVLRKLGAMISEGSSWERTAMNLLWQLRNNPDIRHIWTIPHVLVLFAEDGAVYLQHKAGAACAALVLNDGRSEGSLCREIGGHYGSEFTVMAAAAAQQFEGVAQGGEFCVRALFENVKAFMETGYPVGSIADYSFALKLAGECPGDGSFDIPLKADGNTQNPDEWQIANMGDVEEIRQTAADFILYGDKHLKGKPILEIGGLKTVDRREIEAFGNIHGMITAYTQNDIQQPLCIAVFGSPGSGKSFGVKQIAGNVLSEKEMETVTFNVSQFTQYAELGTAFQKVRDIRLSGKLPLVFFDEFDSAGLDGKPLGWLKYFLAPMQDGEFCDANGAHPIGKCILVFAGGTSNTFKAFQTPKDKNQFKDQKGPDFVSRIKGSVDIAGPNPREDEDNGGMADNAYILRRALLIRSLCERDKRLKAAVKSNQGEYISRDIVDALLLVRSFNYGARSVETILGLSKIVDGQWLPSGLPNGEQMGIHVKDRAFTDALLIKVIENAPEGKMAKEIHALYRSHLAPGDSGNDIDWADLPLHYKLSNLGQARGLPEYVARIGGRIDDAGLEDEILDLAGDAALVEKLAQEEHDRWMREKADDGWKYGKVKDAKRKTHPCMLAWKDLNEYTREKDRNPIREIPQVLAAADLCAYKA